MDGSCDALMRCCTRCCTSVSLARSCWYEKLLAAPVPVLLLALDVCAAAADTWPVPSASSPLHTPGPALADTLKRRSRVCSPSSRPPRLAMLPSRPRVSWCPAAYQPVDAVLARRVRPAMVSGAGALPKLGVPEKLPWCPAVAAPTGKPALTGPPQLENPSPRPVEKSPYALSKLARGGT